MPNEKQTEGLRLTIRPARWPDDGTALSRLDPSFTTAMVYRPVRDELSFRLAEQAVEPPLRKTYPFRPADPEERREWDYAVVAEDAETLVGFAAAQYAAWNRRVIVQHLYVAPRQRRRGVGTRLLDALDTFAQSVGARCLWLETQNVNVPALRFYRRSGFQFCGFDDSLYDPAVTAPGEVALFFARPVSAAAPPNA